VTVRTSLDRSTIVTALRAAGCVFAEEEAELLIDAAGSPAELATMVARRAAGDPLEQVLGWAGFHGLRVTVEPGVFVPRRRTEFLVDQAIALTRPGAVVLDLCCGSGAVGAALRAAVGQIELHAVDIDPAAVRSARSNLPGAHVHQGDLYQPLPAELRGRVGVLLVIAPYVPTGSIALMPPEAREHEPLSALDGGPDGLDVLRRVLADARGWLTPGGHLLTELGDDQVPAALAECTSHRLTARVTTPADGSATVLIAEPG
jgi:release factor glutamine methyltransferase